MGLRSTLIKFVSVCSAMLLQACEVEGDGAATASSGTGSGGMGGGTASSVSGVQTSSSTSVSTSSGTGGAPLCTEGATAECYSADPGTKNVGACKAGTETCTNGMWTSCDGEVVPSIESCNGVDDDCNGQIDELGQDTCGFGACKITVDKCTGGAPQACVPPMGNRTELCEGTDDDCDGVIDEGCRCSNGATQPCYSAGPDTLGVGACHGGTQTCVDGHFALCVGEAVPTGETCNGFDDDCDGVIDDNPGEVGQSCGESNIAPCAFGTLQCQGGQLSCLGVINPESETCNGIDDNCNGTVDDSTVGAGAQCGQTDVGPCALGTIQCLNAQLACSGAIDPQPETCNGVDDDCNGILDDNPAGTGASCGPSNVFPCAFGTIQCQNGSLGCVGSVNPQPESCNGVDDDCDGTIDDSPVDAGGSCGSSNVGACVFGTIQCQGGSLACNGAVNPQQEFCNGVDDDCDGTIDDACL